MDRAALDALQSKLEEQVKEHFPDDGVQRVVLLQHGDDPQAEPGDLLVRVFIEEAEESPHLPSWHRDHETMVRELQREIAAKLPVASRLEIWFGENGRQGGRNEPFMHVWFPPDALRTRFLVFFPPVRVASNHVTGK